MESRFGQDFGAVRVHTDGPADAAARSASTSWICDAKTVTVQVSGDDQSALRMYRRALEIDSSYLPTYTNLAFFYEQKGDIENATKYWAKRYDMGQEGEYWREVALQHLLALGTYPEAKRQWLEQKAACLTQNLIYQREQERLQVIEEARLHFNIGCDLRNCSYFN